LRDYLLVKPVYLGPGYRAYCEEHLRQKVEGTCLDPYGIVVAVVGVKAADIGKLQEGTGLVMVPMVYEAIILHIFKGEVLDCVIDGIDEKGVFGYIGPVRVFVSRTMLPGGWTYTEDDVHAGSGAAYRSSAADRTIRVGSALRVQVLATRQENNSILAIAQALSEGSFDART